MVLPVCERRVRRFLVVCHRADHARQALIRLEDALRTASLGDETRLLVVRRLNLARVPLGASATTWSLRLEEQFRRLRAVAVPVGDATAAQAEVVSFRDVDEPWLQLVERVLRGQPCGEWFWVKATPGWKPGMSAAETLRLALHTLARKSTDTALVLVRRLASAGLGVEFLNALRLEDLRRALPELASIPLAQEPLAASIPGLIEMNPPAWLRPLLTRLPTEDARADLLVAAAVSGEGLPLPSPRVLTFLAAKWREGEEQPGSPDRGTLSIPPRSETKPASVRPQSPASARQEARAVEAKVETKSSLRNQAGLFSQVRAETEVTKTPQLFPPAPATREQSEDHPLHTSAGGLFFLVRLFELVELPDILRRQPELDQAGLPWRLFRAALRLTQVRDDDAWWLLPCPALPLPAGSLWRPLLRAHHLCRALTVLSLRALICRPALVALAETHIDVFFRANEADVRIRRAALDVDPGWVPWLRRRIAFHYNRET